MRIELDIEFPEGLENFLKKACEDLNPANHESVDNEFLESIRDHIRNISRFFREGKTTTAFMELGALLNYLDQLIQQKQEE